METNTPLLLATRILGALIIFAIFAFLVLAFVLPGISHRHRLPANESAAASSLRTIYFSNSAYANDYPQQGYAKKLSDLSIRPQDHGRGAVPDWMIDPVLASGEKSGYKFTYRPQSTKGDGKFDAFQAFADPLAPGKTGNRHFFVDETGMFRTSATGPANATSDALQ